MTKDWSHIDDAGHVRMVDVTEKKPTYREARAEGFVYLKPGILDDILSSRVPKGNVLETARIAGIMAAKRTWELIPLCHPLQITSVNIEFDILREKSVIRLESVVKTTDRTGVEMEALTAVSVAALTIYDMCKALDKSIAIDQIRLTYKTGGKSGTFER